MLNSILASLTAAVFLIGINSVPAEAGPPEEVIQLAANDAHKAKRRNADTKATKTHKRQTPSSEKSITEHADTSNQLIGVYPSRGAKKHDFQAVGEFTLLRERAAVQKAKGNKKKTKKTATASGTPDESAAHIHDSKIGTQEFKIEFKGMGDIDNIK